MGGSFSSLFLPHLARQEEFLPPRQATKTRLRALLTLPVSHFSGSGSQDRKLGQDARSNERLGRPESTRECRHSRKRLSSEGSPGALTRVFGVGGDTPRGAAGRQRCFFDPGKPVRPGKPCPRIFLESRRQQHKILLLLAAINGAWLTAVMNEGEP